MKILIQNGRVMDPMTGRDEMADVAIAAGRIIAIGQISPDFHPNRTLDASGCVLAPGLMDLALRLREPGSAANIAMAETEPMAAEIALQSSGLKISCRLQKNFPPLSAAD